MVDIQITILPYSKEKTLAILLPPQSMVTGIVFTTNAAFRAASRRSGVFSSHLGFY
jgi:hypothetical protein